MRIARSADGATLALDESARAALAEITGTAASNGPLLASPFAGYALHAWLREHIDDGPAAWSLRSVSGRRLIVLVDRSGALVERTSDLKSAGGATTKPVHDIRNHLNIIQTTVELVGMIAAKGQQSALEEPIARVLRQVPPMSTALERISSGERERFGASQALLPFLRSAIDRSAWSGRLVVDSDSAVEASPAWCDAVTRSIFEWTSHELALHGRGRIGIADSGAGDALVFSGLGIGDWLRSGEDGESRMRDWLRPWEALDVAAGAWATPVGGGALIGLPP